MWEVLASEEGILNQERLLSGNNAVFPPSWGKSLASLYNTWSFCSSSHLQTLIPELGYINSSASPHLSPPQRMFGFTHEAPMRLEVPFILINVEKGARVLVRLYFSPLQQRETFPQPPGSSKSNRKPNPHNGSSHIYFEPTASLTGQKKLFRP